MFNSKALSILSLAFSLIILAFGYGVAVMQWHLWPYEQLNRARVAYQALMEVQQVSDLYKRFHEMEYFVPGEPGEPYVSYTRPNTDFGSDLLLVNGGRGQYRRLCPNYGCLAWIVDRQGKVMHRWEVDMEAVWPDVQRISGYKGAYQVLPIDFKLYDNGDLLVNYQLRDTYPYGLGFSKFDKAGKLLWKKENLSHHWFSVGDDGRIYTPSSKPLPLPHKLGGTRLELHCNHLAMHEETILTLSPEGEVLDEFSVLKVLEDADYMGLLFEKDDPWTPGINRVSNNEDRCDPIHVNSVEALPASIASEYPGLEAGDLLISMRNINSVMIVDGKTHKLKWIESGRSVLQHSAIFYRDNKILMLDNQGGEARQGGSRVIAVDVGSHEMEVMFPTPDTPDDIHFHTYASGEIVLSPDRNRLMVTLTHEGRAMEIDLNTRERLWEYVNNQDILPYLEDKEVHPEAGGKVRFSIHSVQYVQPGFTMNPPKP